MATDMVSHDLPQSFALGVSPCVDHLVTEDDTPVDSIFSEKQQRLLTEPLFSSWAPEGEGRTFVALANVGLFYSVRQPPFVPDMMLSLDVELPPDVHPKPYRSYFLWEYGKPPDVVIEVVSNREGGETTDKLTGYATIGVKYYVVYDPDRLLSETPLRAFRLEVGEYREMAEPIWLPRVGLGLQEWHGRYEDMDNTWLRWVDKQGRPIPTGAERADREQARAENLLEQLRRLGVEPEL